MKCLELFSGTHSVGKVLKEAGYEVISLDIDGKADINIDILNWDYKEAYPTGYFDVVWASPPCATFSHLQNTNIGRKMKNGEIRTKEIVDENMYNIGLPLLRKAQEIIAYFQPKFWFIENPFTSRMKDFIKNEDKYVVDYCRYADWGYRKRTSIWTNKKGFIPLLCEKKCNSMDETKKKHKILIGMGKSKEDSLRLDEKYRIPPKLIEELLLM